MSMTKASMCRLVKGCDLNHHGTLFAGRGAEWFVEAGFITAASVTAPERTVCAKIHGMVFTRPVKKGSIVRAESQIVLAGKTSLTVYVKLVIHPQDEFVVDGFLTFVNVDAAGRPTPHGITVTADTPEEEALQVRARTILSAGGALKNNKVGG